MLCPFWNNQKPMHDFKQDDQSDYLIHLVGKNKPYASFMDILHSRVIKARNAFGFKRYVHKKESVCFSEIPPFYLQKLVQSRYNYGIAFKKDWLLAQGAQRVWYIEKDSKTHSSLDHLSDSLNHNQKKDFFDLAPFIDIPGEYGNSVYRFEWEREWRIIGDLSFSPDDVEFLILPCDVHEGARAFFSDAEQEQYGPNYNCPYYDPITDKYSKDT
jgi:hypothetical protein